MNINNIIFNSSKPILYTLLSATLIAACAEKKSDLLQGYAEGEFVRIAAPFAGTLEKLQVKRGEQIAQGAALFALESQNENAARREAEQRLQSAEARLANLKTGKRPQEISVINAQLAQAAAAQKLSAAQLARDEKLFADGFISKERVDEARAALTRDSARIAELNALVQTANLAARSDEIRGAASEAEAARAALEQAQWRLAQKTVTAPIAALVFDTLYAQGEFIPAGNPVVSLLPPENIKLRFFVPETRLGEIKLGQKISASCDGCAVPVTAAISYISRQPEYTPPIIYSKESRAKLVYLVEARPAPADAVKLHPGQPVDVALQ
ncbi:MAG: HlyD family efflux transporter periplasmic adaptor subunit [Burkholderiales bacterium]